jgi:hypothetical protein
MALAALIVLAAVLRFATLDLQSLGYDEAFHGSVPLEHYLPGAVVGSAAASRLTLVQPLRRHDAGGPARDPAPPPPPGFPPAGRRERDSYTLTSWRSSAPVQVTPAMALALAPDRPGREPFILSWPNGTNAR